MSERRDREAEPEPPQPDELEREGEELPDRIAMSLIDANVAIPVDAAIAANVLADESIAESHAEQSTDVEQGGGNDGAE